MADCPNCEYHKNRAARWRAEAYKQAGHDVIELPWVGLTDDEVVSLKMLGRDLEFVSMTALRRFARDIEQTLKEKNI